MRRRIASINDVPITAAERKYHWPLGRRPTITPRSAISASDAAGRVAAFASLAVLSLATGSALAGGASPIYGITIPDGYRGWELVAPSLEAEPLDELRAILGNDVAIAAYRAGTLPFPDGSIVAKLAWKRVQSSEFAAASVPGAATTVQFMVKDSKRYAATGGWGFGRFVDSEPANAAQHQTCFGCHETNVQEHDLVFTRLAR